MSTKFTKIFVGLMAAVMMMSASSAYAAALTQAQVDAIISLLQSFGADATTVANVNASLTGGTVTTPSTTGIVLSKSLKMGDNNADVKNLQIILNKDAATQVASTGAGSPGNESTYFGSMTKAAVIKFQNKYASEVLTPVGLTAGTGYVGAMTIAKLNAVAGGTTTGGTTTGGTTTGGTTTTVPAGTGLTISSATQPTATITPEGAARVPFTKVTLTAGSDGDVTVTGVNVERTGLANDAVFAGVVLLDESGQQLGIAKTFNSDHKLTVGESFTVKAGQSRTMTIAGNMLTGTTALDAYAGQVAYLSVTGANTTATVSGTLPITGAGHTINATLTIGSATMARGSTDPGANQSSKEVGATAYTFSAVRVTAGSAEKVRIKSIRWNQSGSAAAADLANIKTYVDGTSYDVTASSDGKYYTTIFGDGIVVDKGANVELAVKGDIVSGSGRTIDFDIYKNTDLYITGETFGYGITPPNGSSAATADTGAFSSSNPWYDAFQVTVSNGTINVEKATSVAAQNIAINLANQPLGGFNVEVKGEPITVASTVFRVSSTTASSITNVSLVGPSGTVVAGPVDVTSSVITFTDTITYPIGKGTYTLKGKLSTIWGNNNTVSASTTPSTDWTTVTGQVTGNSITPSPTSAITGNTMTVKTASLTIAASAAPVAQTVVSGGRFTFANYQFDASASGEDIKMSSVPLAYGVNGAGTATNLTSCQLYDGTTVLNSGSNIVNPSAAGSSTTFTFDGTGLVLPKGTIKTISVQCNIAGGASGGYLWGIDLGATFSATGLTSGSSVTPTATDSNGQLMTLTSAGTLTVSLDASSPSYAIGAAGSTVTLGVLKFHAANEAIELKKVALQLTNGASTSPEDLVKVSLWDGATKVGETIFTTTDNSTTTLSTPVTIAKDSDKLITIKGELAAIGTSQPGTQGHLMAVDYDGGDSTGTQGNGVNSGTTISQTSSSDTASAGVRIFKSFPTFAKLTSGSSKLTAGNLSLYRFSVKADAAGDIGISKFTIRVATSSATAGTKVENINVYAYSDSGFSTPVSGIGSAGQFMQTANTAWVTSATDLEIYAETTAVASTTVQVPAGQTRYFEVRGDATVAGATYSVSTQIQGDAAYPVLSTFMDSAANIDNATNGDFLWAPNATTSVGVTANDWTNGYGVAGLPSTNMTAEILTQ